MTDPVNTSWLMNMVTRGGHQLRYPLALRAAFRFYGGDWAQNSNFGSRCVRSL